MAEAMLHTDDPLFELSQADTAEYFSLAPVTANSDADESNILDETMSPAHTAEYTPDREEDEEEEVVAKAEKFVRPITPAKRRRKRDYTKNYIRCAVCSQCSESYPAYIQHCTEKHNFKYTFFERTFTTFTAFNAFRRQLREERNTQLSSLPGMRTFNDGTTVYSLRCERSGRARKSGTRKCGKFCTTYLTIYRYSHGPVKACGVLDHFGHDPNYRGVYGNNGEPLGETDPAAPMPSAATPPGPPHQTDGNVMMTESQPFPPNVQMPAEQSQPTSVPLPAQTPTPKLPETVSNVLSAVAEIRQADEIRSSILVMAQEMQTLAAHANGEQLALHEKNFRQIFSHWEAVRMGASINVYTSRSNGTPNTFPYASTSAFSSTAVPPPLQALHNAYAQAAYNHQLQSSLFPPYNPYPY